MPKNPVITLTEAQPAEREYFERALEESELRFVAGAEDVPGDTEILSVYIHTPIDAPFLDAHPALRLVTTRSTGYDHIDVAACAGRGIPVCNIRSVDETAVAEHTFALLLAISRRLMEARVANQQPVFDYEALQGFDLAGKTLGVIGTGRVGQRVIQLARAFRMNVLAHDCHRSGVAEELGATYLGFDDVLRRSEILTLHTPLTAGTRHMLNREAFKKCRRGIVVINTARGGLIDTHALIRAMDEGIVDAAGLDVLEDESVMQKEASRMVVEQIIERVRGVDAEVGDIPPRPQRIEEIQSLYQNSGLLSRPNVVFTPHVAFNSRETVEKINAVTVESIRAFLSGHPVNVVGASGEMPRRLQPA